MQRPLLIGVIIVLLLISACSTAEPMEPTDVAAAATAIPATLTPAPTKTPQPSETPAPTETVTVTPTGTATAEPTIPPTETPGGITLDEGVGTVDADALLAVAPEAVRVALLDFEQYQSSYDDVEPFVVAYNEQGAEVAIYSVAQNRWYPIEPLPENPSFADLAVFRGSVIEGGVIAGNEVGPGIKITVDTTIGPENRNLIDIALQLNITEDEMRSFLLDHLYAASQNEVNAPNWQMSREEFGQLYAQIQRGEAEMPAPLTVAVHNARTGVMDELPLQLRDFQFRVFLSTMEQYWTNNQFPGVSPKYGTGDYDSTSLMEPMADPDNANVLYSLIFLNGGRATGQGYDVANNSSYISSPIRMLVFPRNQVPYDYEYSGVRIIPPIPSYKVYNPNTDGLELELHWTDTSEGTAFKYQLIALR